MTRVQRSPVSAQRGRIDGVFIAAVAVACPLLGAAAGLAVPGLVLGLFVGVGYGVYWRRRGGGAAAVAHASAVEATPLARRETVWRDAEEALQQLDRRAQLDDAVGRACTALTRAGRRAVEQARQQTSDVEGSRIRRLLVSSAEVVRVYCRAHGTVADSDVADRLERVAQSLTDGGTDRAAERRLQSELRVLDGDLRREEAKMSDGHTVTGERPRDDAARSSVDAFTSEANAAFDLDTAEREQRDRIEQIKRAFDWEHPERFAEQEAHGVSQFADTIIGSVRSAELGSIHDHLTDLRMITKRLGNKLEPKGWLGRLLFNGRKALEQFAADWDTVGGQIDDVIAMLEKDKRGSAVSIENLRQLREEAIGNFRNMAAAIVAGRELLAEARTELEDLRAQEHADDDAVASAAIRRREQQIDVFDRRLTNLEKSRAIAAGMIPTIQQTLHSEIVVSEELDMALTQTIPVMKQQLALTAEQVRQQERLQSLSATRQTTEQMMEEIGDRLQTNQAMVDEQVREGIASAEKVAAFLEKIGSTIDEIDRRQADAQADRKAARGNLQQAVEDLGQRLARPVDEAPTAALAE